MCGARGGGDAAAQGLFLALSPSLVFMLACEASRERNAAIMLIRRFALEVGAMYQPACTSLPCTSDLDQPTKTCLKSGKNTEFVWLSLFGFIFILGNQLLFLQVVTWVQA